MVVTLLGERLRKNEFWGEDPVRPNSVSTVDTQ